MVSYSHGSTWSINQIAAGEGRPVFNGPSCHRPMDCKWTQWSFVAKWPRPTETTHGTYWEAVFCFNTAHESSTRTLPPNPRERNLYSWWFYRLRVSKLFRKGPNSKYFTLWGHVASVSIIQSCQLWCRCGYSVHIHKQMWLCSNKTWLATTGCQVHRPSFANPHSGPVLSNRNTRWTIYLILHFSGVTFKKFLMY